MKLEQVDGWLLLKLGIWCGVAVTGAFGQIGYYSDSDSDGLTDDEESSTYFTDPYNSDTDADGLSDYDEVFYYLSLIHI